MLFVSLAQRVRLSDQSRSNRTVQPQALLPVHTGGMTDHGAENGASGTAGLAWDERNRVGRDTAGRDSRVTAGFSALEAVQDGAACGEVEPEVPASTWPVPPLAFTPIARLFETVRGHNPSLGC